MQPWYWLVFGLLLMTLEIFLPSFAALWFGVAAVVVALIAWLIPMGVTGQVVLWLVLSVLCCLLWFKFIQPKIKNRTQAGLGGAVIIGEVGLITAVPVNGVGKVRFSVPKVGADEWLCRSVDDMPLALGDRVVVVNILGNELIVAKK